MYKLDLPLDTKEAAAIAARRNREQQRQSRIFDARTRQIGVDTETLSKQIEEKRLREEAEKERNRAYDADIVRQAQVCSLLDQRRDQEVRKLNEQMNKFRLEEQTAPTRREFDLYDPKGKQKDVPARVSDDDPRCQASSLQLFQGEDLSGKERKQKQQEQMREWIKQQLGEKNREKQAENYSNSLYEKKMVEMDNRSAQLAREEDECRRNVSLATKQFNEALAAEKKARDNLNKQKELDDNFTELTNQIYGDTLSENPLVAKSSFGEHRVVPDRWKGMSPGERSDIMKTVANQCEVKSREKDAEAQLKAENDKIQLIQAQTAILQQREQERKSREIQKRVAEENLRLAEEQRLKMKYLNQEVYTNPPNDDYFAQFNTCTR